MAPTLFLARGFFYNPSSPSLAARILQIFMSKLLIALPNKVGGSTTQQRQFFVGLLASVLNPLVFPSNLTLLLTSITTRGALDTFLLAYKVEVVSGL
jgi:hypothetical protein